MPYVPPIAWSWSSVRSASLWTTVAPEALPVEAQEVAGECGYLPFALALNGAMHQQGVAWPHLLDALRSAEIDYAEHRFKGYPYRWMASTPDLSNRFHWPVILTTVDSTGTGAA